jgi:hypothetical protein
MPDSDAVYEDIRDLRREQLEMTRELATQGAQLTDLRDDVSKGFASMRVAVDAIRQCLEQEDTGVIQRLRRVEKDRAVWTHRGKKVTALIGSVITAVAIAVALMFLRLK